MCLLDVFSLLDEVLLHEMTHAQSTFKRWGRDDKIEQEGLADVGTPGIVNLIPAYGWTRLRKLALAGGDLGTSTAADNNAETVAVLGNGKFCKYVVHMGFSQADSLKVCKLLDDPNNPRTVDADGRIIPRV